MAFFDNLGKKISVVAGSAADKAKDLGEIAKLKAEILGVQSDVNAALLELGRKAYEQSKNDAESPYAEDCAKLTGFYDQIESLRARIALVKADNDPQNDCVVNLDTPAAPEQPAAPEEAEAPAAAAVCPVCGEAVENGAAFCSKCGAKL